MMEEVRKARFPEDTARDVEPHPLVLGTEAKAEAVRSPCALARLPRYEQHSGHVLNTRLR